MTISLQVENIGATPQYFLLLLQSGNKFLSCYSGDLFFELLKYTLFNMKVLVVEDDVFVNSMLKQNLESAGLSVTTVFDVSGALTSIAVTEPNVIITDLDLGDGPSGADLINIVSKKLPWVNIIVLSTHRNPALAIYPSSTLPPGINYITKGDLAHEQNLITIVKESMVSKSNLEIRMEKSVRIQEVRSLNLNTSKSEEILNWNCQWDQIRSIDLSFNWWVKVLNQEMSPKEACLEDIRKFLQESESKLK
jgi:ActR/RegA family two-component response regulator